MFTLSRSILHEENHQSPETNLNDTVMISYSPSISEDDNSYLSMSNDEMSDGCIEVSRVILENNSDINMETFHETSKESSTEHLKQSQLGEQLNYDDRADIEENNSFADDEKASDDKIHQKFISFRENCEILSVIRISRSNIGKSQKPESNNDSDHMNQYSLDNEEPLTMRENIPERTLLEVDPIPADVNTKLLKLGTSDEGLKKHFCKYCKTLQTKLARHLENKHSIETEVKLFLNLPKKSSERLNIISNIRKAGNSLYNNYEKYNEGDLILERRPHATKNRGPNHYIPCKKCNALYSVLCIKAHYKHCEKMGKVEQKNVFTAGLMKNNIEKCSSLKNRIYASITMGEIKKKRGRGVKKHWSVEEKQKVLELFGENLITQKLPSLAKCRIAIMENDVLKDRTPEMLKVYIYNNMRKFNV